MVLTSSVSDLSFIHVLMTVGELALVTVAVADELVAQEKSGTEKKNSEEKEDKGSSQEKEDRVAKTLPTKQSTKPKDS
jgi:hypothetical protein